MRVLEPADVFEIVPKEREVEPILGVEREVVRDRDAADRSERQALDMSGLRLISRHGVRLRADRGRRVSDGQCAHAVRRREIALEQRRREDEQIAYVVESERRVVRGQKRRDVDLEIEQIANRVRVLCAVQPLERRCARIGLGRRVERRLEPAREAFVGRRGRPRRVRRRHRASPQLPDDALPDLRIAVNGGRVERRHG